MFYAPLINAMGIIEICNPFPLLQYMLLPCPTRTYEIRFLL